MSMAKSFVNIEAMAIFKGWFIIFVWSNLNKHTDKSVTVRSLNNSAPDYYSFSCKELD